MPPGHGEGDGGVIKFEAFCAAIALPNSQGLTQVTQPEMPSTFLKPELRLDSHSSMIHNIRG
eukprot:2458658-Rhodomonas_salina.1